MTTGKWSPMNLGSNIISTVFFCVLMLRKCLSHHWTCPLFGCAWPGILNLPKCPGIDFCSIHCVRYWMKALHGTGFLNPAPACFLNSVLKQTSNIVYNFHALGSRYQYVVYLNHLDELDEACWMQGCQICIFLHRIWLHLNWRVDLILMLPWDKVLKYCINYI